MTRPVHALLAALLAALLVLLSAGVRAQALPLKLEPIRASEHVYYFPGGAGMASSANRAYGSNASLVVTGDGVVVFDTIGTPALGAAMKAAIAGVTKQPIRLVIVSHFHPDHFYGLQALVEPGVDVWAAVRELVPFDEACKAANRINACGT